jgi:hypothetical protein
MNVLLWMLQAVLALLYVAGGTYKLFVSGQLATQMPALPAVGWSVLGLIEMAGGLCLIIPGAGQWRTKLPPLAAAALAVETFALAALYAGYSLELTAANPLVWSVVMGLLVAFLAYARYAIKPVRSQITA